MKTLPQQLWGSFFGCTSVATPATLGYPSNSGVVGKHLSLGLSISHSGSLSHSHTHTHTLGLSLSHSHTHSQPLCGETSLTGSLYLSLGLSLTLSHSHTHTLTHNHSTSLSFTLIHTNKNDRGKLPFLKTSRLPLMNESTTSGCEF